MKQEKANIFALDALRVLCILAVVLIHSSTRILERSGYNLTDFYPALFLDQVGRFAVPLFFMISGFVLQLHYHLNESFVHFFKKRINRVLGPYLFWSLIYYFLIYRVHSSGLLETLLTGNASYQLYFIPSVILFYFLFPLLNKFRKFFEIPLVLVVLGAVQTYILYSDYYLGHYQYPLPVNIFIFNFFIFIVGMTMAKHHEYLINHIKKILWILVPVVVYLPFYLANEGRDLYFKTYDIGKFYSSWRPMVLFYTLAFAGVSYYVFSKFDLGHRFFKKMSNLSFFVYFIHTMVLEFVWNNFGEYIKNTDKTGFLLFLTVSFLSFSVAFVVHKVKNLSKITG